MPAHLKRSRHPAGTTAAQRARHQSSYERNKRPRYNGNARTGGFEGIELKFIDYEYDATVSQSLAGAEADPATALSLSSIAQGDGESNRDGRKATLKSVFVRGRVFLNAAESTSVTAGANVKLVLLLDQQTNGAQFNAEDVYVDPTDTSLDCFTGRNLQYSRRFRVLATKEIEINPPAAASDTSDAFRTGTVMQQFTMAAKLNEPVQYNGTTAVVASISTSSLHLIAVSDSDSGACTLQYFSRVRFLG